MHGRVIHFSPSGTSRGNVLISYVTLPYLNRDPKILEAHTNRWEGMCIVESWLEKGFAVDLIDTTNTSFVPKKSYDYVVDNGTNMDRLAPLLGRGCVKIFHATTSHWKFNNDAEEKRFRDLSARRGEQVRPDRVLPPNHAIELCDHATLIGNRVTAQTYAFANKPITLTPISTTHTFESPAGKDFDAARKHFIWFGGAGVIHKGLDLVVEAFARMPEFNLTICGKIDGETEFKKIFAKELALPNISVAGFVYPGSEVFKKIAAESLALIYPSCSEGQAGSVVLAMHAGLIPIVSRESGVNVDTFGVILKENTIEEIMAEVTRIVSLPQEELRERSVETWSYAQAHHTRETFKKTYREFLDGLIVPSRV